MPSDERVGRVLEKLVRERTAFRDTVSATVTDIRSFLVSSSVAKNGRAQRLAAELGPFGRERFDVERLATFFAEPETLDTMTSETVEKALNTLAALAARDEDLFTADVAPGESLRRAVSKTLGEIGRVFGAARIVERIRTGRYRYSEHARALGSFPFRQWTRTERRMVPPITMAVDGRDLHAIELAEFLDGTMKLILVVQGECAPAPLVRLITPQTFVVQTTDTEDLNDLLTWDGAGIGAVVPSGAARFVHDPTAGTDLWDRITVSHIPSADPRKAVGSMSAAQQVEELRQLRALATKPPSTNAVPATASERAGGAEAQPAEPVDKLAAWLLGQADLTGVDSD